MDWVNHEQNHSDNQVENVRLRDALSGKDSGGEVPVVPGDRKVVAPSQTQEGGEEGEAGALLVLLSLAVILSMLVFGIPIAAYYLFSAM